MIGTKMGWHFMEFIAHCSVVSLPAAIAGFFVCFSLEFFKCPGFRYQMPERARELILKDYNKKIREMTVHNFYVYAVQIIVFILLVLALAFHVAEVGLIGIGMIVIVTAFTGLTKEHDLGVAFNNAMPFAVLIMVFFAILGVVHEQHLVTPLAEWVFTFSGKSQLIALYFTNGTLSFVSDNVFIATIFINEVENAYVNGIIAQMIDNMQAAYAGGTMTQFINEAKMAYDSELITQFVNRMEIANANGTIQAFMNAVSVEYADKAVISREDYEKLAVVVNMGTNIPAMATPNGHAALLFLLTSSLAPLLKLSYYQMFKLALPYTIVMTLTGALAIYFYL
jgi:NhaB family Na+:H+ antiporter